LIENKQPRDSPCKASTAEVKKSSPKMMQQSRRRTLVKAVRDAAIKLATRADGAQYATTLPDNNRPRPDEPVVMLARIESAPKGPYLDNNRPKRGNG
jgi:hypothetical protein